MINLYYIISQYNFSDIFTSINDLRFEQLTKCILFRMATGRVEYGQSKTMPGPRPTYPCPTHARKAYRAKSHARRAWVCRRVSTGLTCCASRRQQPLRRWSLPVRRHVVGRRPCRLHRRRMLPSRHHAASCRAMVEQEVGDHEEAELDGRRCQRAAPSPLIQPTPPLVRLTAASDPAAAAASAPRRCQRATPSPQIQSPPPLDCLATASDPAAAAASAPRRRLRGSRQPPPP